MLKFRSEKSILLSQLDVYLGFDHVTATCNADLVFLKGVWAWRYELRHFGKRASPFCDITAIVTIQNLPHCTVLTFEKSWMSYYIVSWWLFYCGFLNLRVVFPRFFVLIGFTELKKINYFYEIRVCILLFISYLAAPFKDVCVTPFTSLYFNVNSTK